MGRSPLTACRRLRTFKRIRGASSDRWMTWGRRSIRCVDKPLWCIPAVVCGRYELRIRAKSQETVVSSVRKERIASVAGRDAVRVGMTLTGGALADRRAFLSGCGLGVLLPARGAGAQSTVGVPRIGLLRSDAPNEPVARAMVDAFLAGLADGGYENGRNVHVEARYTERRFDRYPAMARELAALPLAAIVTANPYATGAVRDATKTIPIVVALDYETDPVAAGWIASIARPGGNLTGLFLDQPAMSAKLLQLLRE